MLEVGNIVANKKGFILRVLNTDGNLAVCGYLYAPHIETIIHTSELRVIAKEGRVNKAEPIDLEKVISDRNETITSILNGLKETRTTRKAKSTMPIDLLKRMKDASSEELAKIIKNLGYSLLDKSPQAKGGDNNG